jgi:PTS system nitrogen regulatory IIA component
MNALGELLAGADVALDADVADGIQLIEFAATRIAHNHGIAASMVVRELTAREHLGCTALGHGVALPHARITGIARPVAAFIRTRQPIPFSALDHKPVSLFLVLLVPVEAAERHLKLIAEAAGLFNDRAFRVALREATDPERVAQLFAQWTPG